MLDTSTRWGPVAVSDEAGAKPRQRLGLAGVDVRCLALWDWGPPLVASIFYFTVHESNRGLLAQLAKLSTISERNETQTK